MIVFKWLKRFFRSGDQPIDIKKVESAIRYHFNNPSFLLRSLKHRSYSQSVDGNVNLSNERLEFLGDSVLSLVVSHYVFAEKPNFQEGDLTKLRSNMVNKKSVAIAGKKIGLDRFILLDDLEENAGGRNRTSIIADAFEAVIGAIFLDGGYKASEGFIKRTILENQDILFDMEQMNYKSHLLELVQEVKRGYPVYKTVSESGPDHDKIFTVEVFVNGESIGTGKGKSKKDAQQMSAKAGLLNIKERISTK